MRPPFDDALRVRVESRFKNARLYEAIVERAVVLARSGAGRAGQRRGPVRVFCQLHGLPYDEVSRLLRFQLAPTRYRRYRRICQRLAAILEADVTYLFPAELYATKWPTMVVREVTLDARALREGQAVLALPPVQDTTVAHREMVETVRAQLDTLPPRQRDVLRWRYGIEDDVERTLEEVAARLGLQKERVRQIQNAALRALRLGRRLRALRPFMHGREIA